jgi:hypothetical protein
MITVKMQDGSTYEVKTLLGAGDSNAKLTKSDDSGKGYLTYGLSLAPANLSGYEVCASRSEGCTKACLFTAGMGQVHSVQRARIAKTVAFFEHRQRFLDMLGVELFDACRKATKQGKKLAVRLNVLSDIQWEKIWPQVFDAFPSVQFYDYTKHHKRMLSFCEGKLPINYHLTFSRSECNEQKAISVLEQGGTVAVVFDNAKLPKEWKGYKVTNGDKTDLRFLDKRGTIVGLYAKGKAKKDESGFVVPTRIPLQTV